MVLWDYAVRGVRVHAVCFVSRTWEEARFTVVKAKGEHSVRVKKRLLHTVAVMNVNVDVQHARKTAERMPPALKEAAGEGGGKNGECTGGCIVLTWLGTATMQSLTGTPEDAQDDVIDVAEAIRAVSLGVVTPTTPIHSHIGPFDQALRREKHMCVFRG